MNRDRCYSTTQLGPLIGGDPLNYSENVRRVAIDLGAWPAPGSGNGPVLIPMPEAFGIVVTHRTHEVPAGHACIALIRRGYVPRWVLWAPAIHYVRASPLKLEVLWPRVPRKALEAGLSALCLTDLLHELETA